MSADADPGPTRLALSPGQSSQAARLLILAAGCAIMALSGVGLGGYLQAPSAPVVAAPADAPFIG